jgi:N12 class adenine-specific DNA methylase/ppGpp synthetase/RelA/SpoT-type nucleotidyltranferase
MPTVSSHNILSEADYPGIFADFDHDHIPNVDDPHPLKAGDTDTVEETELSNLQERLINIHNQYVKVVNDVMDKLRRMFPDATVKGRAKTPYSILNKLERKRLKPNIVTAKQAGEQIPRGLTDLAGCEIVVKDQQELNKVVKKIKSGAFGDVFQHEDKYKNPSGGYRAHHFLVNYHGHLVEIQCKTQRIKTITSESHTPYKKGLLNEEAMNRLTNLAMKADRGDQKAQKQFAEVKKGNLQKQLTVRQNPAPELKQLKDDFRDSIQKIAVLDVLGKLPEGKKEQLFALLRHHGGLIGLDFDGIYQHALEQAEINPKAALRNLKEGTNDEKEEHLLDENFELGRRDLDLSEFRPIHMTTAERAEANDAALAVLQKQDRAITAADIDALRQYTGNGGLKNKAYGNEELEGKKRGSLNEHYTSYPVIQMVWDKLGGMGVESGNILEPGAGIGNFAGFLPNREAMRMLMVEQSVVSSRIASLLYPNQIVLNEKFQNADLTPYNLTGVIGNVPFGDYRVATRQDKFRELNPQIHDYFILKSLDALKPGGWLAIITSVGTMDKKTDKARKAMIELAGLVGAYRLPSTAFKENADTLVTTDLLIFQKYIGNKNAYAENNTLFAQTPRAVETGRFGKENKEWEAYYNAYYKEHPENILGEHIQGHNVQFPSRMGVKGAINKETIDKVLNDGLSFKLNLPEKQSFYDVPDSGIRLDISRDYHAGNIIYHEDNFYEKQRVFYKKITVGGSGKAGEGLRDRIQSACKLLDIYDDFITALAQNSDQKEPLRGDLKAKLKEHIDQYGIPDEDKSIRDVFKYDNRLYKLTTFVKRDPITDKLIYADILDAETMYSDNYTPKLDNSADLTEVAIFGHNIGETLDEDFYLSTWKGGTSTPDELKKAFQGSKDFFLDPESSRFEFRYDYLAGDVRKKLQLAEDNGLQKNITALKAMLPEWIDIFKIQADPRHIFTYLPYEILQQFIKQKLQYQRVEIGLFKDKAGSGNRFYLRLREWGSYVKSGGETTADYNVGWGTIPFSKILNNYIQEKQFPWVVHDGNGNVLKMSKKNLERRAATDEYYKNILELSTRKQSDFNERMLREVPQIFNTWLRTEAPSEIRDTVETIYNGTFNAHVNPRFDGSTLKFRGMSDTFYGDADFRVFKHNRAVAEKLVWNGRGANNHDVGAGKTMASIITSQVLLQQGSCQKPMFVVPGKVQEKWVEEYSQLFPDAKILNMKMDAETRHKELTMAQLYNWDAIFLADHSFKRLSLSPEEQAKRFGERVRYFDKMLEEFSANVESEDGMTGAQEKRIAKSIEKQKEEFETRLQNVTEAKRLESDIFFDELGVDALFFDEAHFYKNALSSPKAQKLGIAANKPSIRAEDALQKTQWLYDKIGYRNVFVLTATPVVNSPIEVWHMLNLCAPDMLKKYEIDNLDNFINLYVRTEEKLVKKTTGKYKKEVVVGGYINLPEMRKIIDEVMDIKSYDQLIQFYEDNPDYYTTQDGTKKPLKPQFRRPNANQEQQIVKPSQIHTLLFDDIVLRANDVLACMKQKRCETRDNFLVITGDGSKIATDLRVYDDDFTGIQDRYLKIGELTKNVKNAYNARTNPAPKPAAEDIYGDFFSKARGNIRHNPAQTYRNQIIFCDWITLEDHPAGSFHALIKQELVKAGLPKKEIAIINGGTIGTRKNGSNYAVKSGDDKEELKKDVQDDFNQGKYRVLIGNKSIAEGMNLQKWTTDIHHMDVPYTPSEIQQRNGRGLRQGNQWETVNITFYLMQDSFDQYRLELVNKKQSWIDELFFGTERTSKVDSESESLNYEQMVAATNSDPRVKKFFNAKAKSDELKGKIATLDEETQRLQSSLASAENDIQTKRDNFAKTIQREKKLSQSTLPDTAQQVLDEGKLVINWRFGSDIQSIENDISNEHKKLVGYRMELNLDVPQTNANGRVLFRLMPQGEREYYGKIKWSSIKHMAPQGLQKAFRWSDDNPVGSGRSLSGNKGDIIADQDDFYDHYDIDIQARRQGGDVSYDDIKSQIGMYDFSNWKPIITQKLAQLFLILERAWVKGAPYRIQRAEEQLGKTEKTLKELEANMGRTKKELTTSREEREKALETQSKLTDVVNDIVSVDYSDRDELYEELNRLAPNFGIKKIIHVRDLDSKEVFSGEQAGPGGTLPQAEVTEVAERENADPLFEIGQKVPPHGVIKERYLVKEDAHWPVPYWQYRIGKDRWLTPDIYMHESDVHNLVQKVQRDNPKADLIYLGISKKLLIDQGRIDKVALQGPLAMLTNSGLNKLFLTPLSALDGFSKEIDDYKADEAFRIWNSYPPDETNYSLDWPDEAKAIPVGTAEQIIYLSDKIMQAGDHKGTEHTYRHEFDPGKRPAVKKGNMLIIANLKINGRGILN